MQALVLMSHTYMHMYIVCVFMQRTHSSNDTKQTSLPDYHCSLLCYTYTVVIIYKIRHAGLHVQLVVLRSTSEYNSCNM